MCRFNIKVEHTKSFNELQVSSQDLRGKLQVLGLQLCLLWDSNYWYISHKDWGEVFADILLNMPKYIAEKLDCEDFALITTARILERYKLNTCGIAIGDSPWGYHGYNIFLSDAGLFYLEPQTGDIYPVEEDSGYKANIVIFG